ncbi:response regulator [Paraburkholderia sp. BL10I2N1]|uniref:response regulator n=1 Tax=Paraburkholderia sp. BL10I2N1 TaxID=1938796 RepID=UPI0010623AB0|nr:response regulator [Paraburkholderia sp. BL10I2N1]TDN70491.1 response regulator receiver domain-containing protein [Paraburkholderia sp. BL10I2N1]
MTCDTSVTALKVFLVEDSIPVRRRMVSLLSAIEGVEIAGEAEEAFAALAAIAAMKIDVAIVDLRLTASTGMEVVAALARLHPEVTTIVLTNHADSSFREACMAAGAHHFFDKTSEFQLARDTIEKLARERAACAVQERGAHHVWRR